MYKHRGYSENTFGTELKLPHLPQNLSIDLPVVGMVVIDN